MSDDRFDPDSDTRPPQSPSPLEGEGRGEGARTSRRSAESDTSSRSHVVTSSRDFDDDEISLLDIAIVLAKHKKLILGLPLLAAIATAGITLLMPNWYTATAKILPPQQSQSNAVAILGQLGALAGGAGQALGVKNPNDTFVAMLKSRTVADNLIQKFDLKSVYEKKLMVDTRSKLKANTKITSGRDGVITIEVDDRDPRRAADLANAYVSELEALTLRLAVTEAGQRRLFFEKQLDKARQDLVDSEVAFRKLQEKTGIINPSGQAGLTVAAAAGLRAQITAKEVQLAALRSFATEENPDLVRAEQELAGLRAQLAKMDGNSDREKGDVLVSIERAPKVSLEYMNRYRDLKYQETLFELLARQFELAKIDEAKNATLIQLLDRAVPPERKSGPVRSRVVLLTLVVSLLITLVGVFIAGSISRLATQPEGQKRLEALKQSLRIRRPGTKR